MMVVIFAEVQELKGQSWLLTCVVLATTLMIGMAVCFTVYTEEV
jgi:hypothetical protein